MKTDRFEKVTCVLCGAVESEPYLTVPASFGDGMAEFKVVRCIHCGLTFVNPRPPVSEFLNARYYEEVHGTRPAIPPADLRRTDRRIRRLKTPLSQAALHRFKHYPLEMTPPMWASWLAPLVGFWIGRNLPPHRGEGRILDVGCHSGLFL